jgi:C4-dicarboxylate-specific signal transduction histidine kinase
MGHRQRLEEPVKERTTELRMANEQLQKEMTARKRAEETSQEKQTGWTHRRY